MSIKVLSQRDPKWGNIKLGTSDVNIANFGCVVTSLAMLADTTPDIVNERLLKVNGYALENLVIWSKVKEALPDMELTKIGWTYDNADVLKNLPCLVEVDGTPIGASKHWVVYIGNKKMLDPWTGKEESTSKYTPLSYRVIKGEFKKEDGDPCLKIKEELSDMRKSRDGWKELDSTNKDKIKSLDKEVDKLNKRIKARDDDNFKLNIEIMRVQKALNQEREEHQRCKAECTEVMLIQEEKIADLKIELDELKYIKEEEPKDNFFSRIIKWWYS